MGEEREKKGGEREKMGVEREKKSKQSECTDERKQQTQCGGSLRITKKNIYVQYTDV